MPEEARQSSVFRHPCGVAKYAAGCAAFLTFIAIYSIPAFDLTTNIIGLGGIVIGVIPWALNRRRKLHN